MAEQELNRAQVGAGLKQMDGKRMAERMRRNRLGESRAVGGEPAGKTDRPASDRRVGAGAGKEPMPGPAHLPPVAEDGQQLRREHHVAVLLPLALRDAQHHPLAVDGGHGEADGLGDAQAGGVARGQDGAMFDGLHPVEKLDHLFRAEHDGQRARPFRLGDHLVEGPALLERDAIEEPERRHGDDQRARRETAFARQVDLVGANLLGTQMRRRAAEMAGEPRNRLDIRLLRGRRQPPHLHVFEHALTEGCHDALLCERPGEFQALAEQRMARIRTGYGGRTTRLAVSVVAGRVCVYRGTRFSPISDPHHPKYAPTRVRPTLRRRAGRDVPPRASSSAPECATREARGRPCPRSRRLPPIVSRCSQLGPLWRLRESVEMCPGARQAVGVGLAGCAQAPGPRSLGVISTDGLRGQDESVLNSRTGGGVALHHRVEEFPIALKIQIQSIVKG